jgi:hypothetical protein
LPNARNVIFKSRQDRETFLKYRETPTERYQAAIHTFCRMDSHDNRMLERLSGTISQIAHPVNCACITYFND